MRKGTVRKEPECHPLDWDSGLRALLWTLGGGLLIPRLEV